MISYGELVLTRTPATVTIDTDQPLPEWTLMPLSLLLDDDAVTLMGDGRHVLVGDELEGYVVVGWDSRRVGLILRRCCHKVECDVALSVDPADIPPVQERDEEGTTP